MCQCNHLVCTQQLQKNIFCRFVSETNVRLSHVFFNPVPSAPQNVTGEQLNSTAVRLHWDPPESPNGIITEYQVTYYGYRMAVQDQQVYYVLMQLKVK